MEMEDKCKMTLRRKSSLAYYYVELGLQSCDPTHTIDSKFKPEFYPKVLNQCLVQGQ